MPARLLTRHTARLVLAWFIAFLAVAGIAPAAQSQSLDSICTPFAVAKTGSPEGGGDATAQLLHKLDCSLCIGVAAPPGPATVLTPSPAPLAHALLPLVSARLASATGAPLPARGPPSLS
jgi:hypothetical protein